MSAWTGETEGTLEDIQCQVKRLRQEVNQLTQESDRSWPQLNMYLEDLEARLRIDFGHRDVIDRHFRVIYEHLGIDVSDATEKAPLSHVETARRLATGRQPWYRKAIARIRGRVA